MVHKPWIDEVTWTVDGEPGVYRRVPEVIDCWFDSGCMPFAQWGFPHQNADGFERSFPADFITEAVDQTRGWFYSLMTISSLMFPERTLPHPFKNCVVLGLMTDEKGKKLSKRDKNYTDPLVLMDRVGADAVRWALYAGTVPGQNTRFFDDAATDAVREFLGAREVETTQIYPMVRGRLTSINGQQVREAVSKEAQSDNALNRELNLTWTTQLQEDNSIVSGRWWNSGDRARPLVSVEARLASRLAAAR